MSQDRLIKFQCKKCKKIERNSFKSKGAAKEKLEMSKFCKSCRKHTTHKEAK